MKSKFSPTELRVIACLIEKQVSTPDQYPLTFNSLLNACNQKSNREPVLNLSEVALQAALDGLVAKRLVHNVAGFNARVPKYQHRFCNSEFGELQFDPQELGVLCELMLRGPQTPGELRSRTARLCSFTEVSEVDKVLERLMAAGHVQRLEREPGKRENRYCQLFGGEPPASVVPVGSALDRTAELEAEVARLRQQVADLEAALARYQSE
ncbi:YceH family protein [Pseudaeromonas paramecii]|uniref:DUF480 domain-containing protein n=1 Tax=Pseudaeromonas paramecii TaxID=2138166 RepID=A0ABP8PVM2_9GAMM